MLWVGPAPCDPAGTCSQRICVRAGVQHTAARPFALRPTFIRRHRRVVSLNRECPSRDTARLCQRSSRGDLRGGSALASRMEGAKACRMWDRSEGFRSEGAKLSFSGRLTSGMPPETFPSRGYAGARAAPAARVASRRPRALRAPPTCGAGCGKRQSTARATGDSGRRDSGAGSRSPCRRATRAAHPPGSCSAPRRRHQRVHRG